MKRIIISLLLATLPSTIFTRPTTALTYALIRILRNETCIAKATRPIMPEAPDESKPLFIWSDDSFDTDLEGYWDHKITCDVEIPTTINQNAYVIMTSFYTMSDHWGSRTITDRMNVASNLSEKTLHKHTVEGKNMIDIEISFTQHPESVK